jgi:hypothetical protein
MKRRTAPVITRKLVKAIAGKTAKREVWRVASNGKMRTVTATAKSTKAMDEAVKIYGRALERLSHR